MDLLEIKDKAILIGEHILKNQHLTDEDRRGLNFLLYWAKRNPCDNCSGPGLCTAHGIYDLRLRVEEYDHEV